MALDDIHFLTDSTAENFYWMLALTENNVKKAKSFSVQGKIQELMQNKYHIISHSYDGFTTKSVLFGDKIGKVLPRGETYEVYMREIAPNGNIVFPLKDLEKAVFEAPDKNHYVVISLAGNDFRENRFNPWSFIRDIPQIQTRYLQILQRVMALKNVRPIIMLQYRTDANNDPYYIYPLLGVIGAIAMAVRSISLVLLTAPIWVLALKISALMGGILFVVGLAGFYFTRNICSLSAMKDILLGKKISMVVLGELMRTFYQPILEQAKKDRIPILDLPNAFNPYNDLYICGIEPSIKGGALIAEGIDHIVKHHDYQGESVLYSKSPQKIEYTGVKNTNPASWRVEYQAKPKKV